MDSIWSGDVADSGSNSDVFNSGWTGEIPGFCWGFLALAGMNRTGSNDVTLGDFIIQDAEIEKEQSCKCTTNETQWSNDHGERESGYTWAEDAIYESRLPTMEEKEQKRNA